jgi:hypothetical protein
VRGEIRAAVNKVVDNDAKGYGILDLNVCVDSLAFK